MYLTPSLHSLNSLGTGSARGEPVWKEGGGRRANGIAAPLIQIVEATFPNTRYCRLKICQGQHWIWTKFTNQQLQVINFTQPVVLSFANSDYSPSTFLRGRGAEITQIELCMIWPLTCLVCVLIGLGISYMLSSSLPSFRPFVIQHFLSSSLSSHEDHRQFAASSLAHQQRKSSSSSTNQLPIRFSRLDRSSISQINFHIKATSIINCLSYSYQSKLGRSHPLTVRKKRCIMSDCSRL